MVFLHYLFYQTLTTYSLQGTDSPFNNSAEFYVSNPIPMAVRSKSKVFGSFIAGISGSISAGGRHILSLLSFVCFQVEVSTTGRSFVQRSPTGCAVSVYYLQT